jgi:hypothetical protein
LAVNGGLAATGVVIYLLFSGIVAGAGAALAVISIAAILKWVIDQ